MGEKKTYQKRTLLAHADMERLGINPIEYLDQVFKRSLEAYDKCRGLSDKGDAGASYLAVAGKAAADLASYKHPKLSAMAIADLRDDADAKLAMTTQEAVKILKSDPFAPDSIESSRVVDAVKSTIQAPFLPSGDKNE